MASIVKDDVDRLFECFKCGVSPPRKSVSLILIPVSTTLAVERVLLSNVRISFLDKTEFKYRCNDNNCKKLLDSVNWKFNIGAML